MAQIATYVPFIQAVNALASLTMFTGFCLSLRHSTKISCGGSIGDLWTSMRVAKSVESSHLRRLAWAM